MSETKAPPVVPAKKEESLEDLKKRIEKEARAKAEAELRAKIEQEVRSKMEAEAQAKANPAAIQPGPRYRTLEKCYHSDILWEKDQEFTYFGVPGPHMLPLNDEAKAAMIKHGIMDSEGNVKAVGNPINDMTKIT